MDYDLAVFIGRFQPIHKSHVQAIRQGLDLANQVLVIVGSSHAAPNIKNPFSFAQRVEMIRASLTPEEQKHVFFHPVRDYFYNELNWVTEVQNAIFQYKDTDDRVALLGHYKDASSYYLSLFPQYTFHAVRGTAQLNSTDIRNNLFDPKDLEEIQSWRDKGTGTAFAGSFDSNIELMLSAGTFEWLKDNFLFTEEHYSLIREFQFIKNYKAQWAQSPYPPTFVTADAVVVKSGHVLVIKRKFEPGKGLYALPGGFIKASETIEQSAIRELKEETRIDVPKPVLHSSIVESKMFDHPSRSLRGRTITTAFYISLGKGELPSVKASDDASGAMWIPLMSLGSLESSFYEDHLHIIQYFISR